MASLNERERVKEQYKTSSNLNTRISIHAKYSVNRRGFGNWIFEQYLLRENDRILELGCGNGSMWKDRTLPGGAELILTVLVAVVMLAGVLLLKKQDGVLKLGELSVRVLPAKNSYAMLVASGIFAVVLQLLAVIAGGVVAYYLIFFAGAWLFALLVYETVKLL